MSYRCAECNAVHYGSRKTIIKSIKNVDYVRLKVFFNRKEGEHKSTFDNKFNGWEIDKQVNVCNECFDALKDQEPSVVNKEKTVNFFFKNSNNKNFDANTNYKDKHSTTRHKHATNKYRRDNRDARFEDGE